MKAQGTNGVSRGHLKECVTAEEDMLSFIPLDKDPIDRSPPLREWISSWLGVESEFLAPKDWFERGHDHQGGSIDSKGFWWPTILQGSFIWSPQQRLNSGLAEATSQGG